MKDQCIFCLNFVAPCYEKTFLDLCPWCKTPLAFTLADACNLGQCCICGTLLSGPSQGLQCITEQGRANLGVGVSHGLCIPCHDRELATFFERKRKRKLLTEAAEV